MENILNIVTQNIELVILAFVLVHFFLYFLGGLIQKRRKAIYRFITTAIFLAALILGINYLIDFTFNFDISFAISGIDLPNGATGNTVNEICESLISGYIQGDGVTRAAQIVVSFAAVVIKFLYFTVIALALYIVYWIITQIIYVILYFIFFRRHDKNKKKLAKEENRRYKKHRLGGGLINGFKGALISLFVFVVLINGPLRMIPNIDSMRENTEEEVGNKLNEIFENEQYKPIFDVISAYQNSFFYTMFNGKEDDLAAQSVDSFINDKIYVMTIDDKQVNLRSEIRDILGFADDFYALYAGFTGEDKTIDFQALHDVCYFLGDSNLVNAILNVGASVAIELDAIKSKVDEYGADLSAISNVNWEQTFKSFGDIATNLGDIYDNLNYIEVTDAKNKLMTIDFKSVNKEKISAVFESLGQMSLLTVLCDELVKVAFELPAVKDKIGDFELNLEDLVWKDEFKGIGDIVNNFLDLGFDCLHNMTKNFKSSFDNLDFGDKNVQDDNGAVGNLVDSIFACQFVDQLFPQLMEKTVLPKIPEDYQSLFDFTSVNDKGWSNELNDLLKLFKDVKVAEKTFFDEEGKINLDIVETLRSETILNSLIITTALQNMFVDAKDGKGVLKDMKDTILIPDILADKAAPEWKTEELNYYVVSKDFDDNSKHYDKYTRIQPAVYETLSDEHKELAKPQYKIVDGELYSIISALSDVTSVLDIKNMSNDGFKVSLSEETLNKLIEEKEDGKCVVEKLSDSLILRTTLSKFITEASDAIVIPSTACDLVKVDEVDKKVVKGEELVSVITAVSKLEVIKDKHIATQEITINNITYNIDDEFEGDFETLTDDQKNAFKTETKTDIDIGLVNTLNDLTDDGVHTKIEYILGCEEESGKAALDASGIMVATLSKFIFDVGDSVIVVDDAKDMLGDTQIIKEQELRNLVDGVIALNKVIDVTNMNSSMDSMLSKYNMDLLNDDKDGESPIQKAAKSLILRTSISKFVFEMDNNIIVVPMSECDQYDLTTVVDGVENKVVKKAIKQEELPSCFKGIGKIGVLKDEYLVTEAFTSEAGVSYEVGKITAEEYKTFTNEDKKHAKIESSFDVNAGLVKNLENYDYICITAKDNFAVGDIIERESYINLDNETKACFKENYQAVDYLVGSEDTVIRGSNILRATISDFLIENNDNIYVPDQGSESVVEEGLVDTDSNPIKIIKKDELKHFVHGLNELKVVKTNYYAIEDFTDEATGTFYPKDYTITEEAYEELEMADKETRFDTDVEVNIGTDIINNLAEPVEDNPSHKKIIYITGDNGSKILYATFSQVIINNADTDSDSLIIPSDNITTYGGKNIIIKTQFENLIDGIVALDLTKEYQCLSPAAGYKAEDLISKKEYEKLSETDKENFGKLASAKLDATVDIIGELLYLNENGRRVDYVIGSDILCATISKYVIENSSSIIIPTNATEKINKYNVEVEGLTSKEVTTIVSTELNELLVSLCELEIVHDGDINASLNTIKKIDGNYEYKTTFETTLEHEVDSVPVIDHINNSLIMRATISDKIINQNGTVKILKVVIEDLDDTNKALDKAELKEFIEAINSMDIITDTNEFKDMDTMTSTILGDEDAQKEISESIILRATLADKVATSLPIPVDGTNFYYDGEVITIEEFFDLPVSAQLESNRLFKDYDNNDVQLLSCEEIINMFKSLDILGITSFSNVNITFNTVKDIKDNDLLDDLLESKIVWNKTNDLVINSTNGSSETKLFNIPEFDADSVVEYSNGTQVIAKAMYDNATIEGKELYTENVIHAYERNIPFAAENKRLKVSEIDNILNLLIFLGGDGDDFAPDADKLKGIYTDPTESAQFASIMTGSVLLEKSVSTVFATIITNAISGTAFSSMGELINSKIADVDNADASLWKNFNSDIDEFEVSEYKGYHDNELVALLNGLSTLSSITNFTQLLTNINYVKALDDSFVLRAALEQANVITSYFVIADYTGAAGTYVFGDVLSIVEYNTAVALDSLFVNIVDEHKYQCNMEKSYRLNYIIEAFDANNI